MTKLALLFAWFLMFATPAPQIQPPSDCARYFHEACNNWKLAEWFPTLVDLDALEQHKPARIPFSDSFMYAGKRPHVGDWGDIEGSPSDGTRFTYGNAGPPRGFAVYDYAHAIAFYSQGCCSWHSTVLAAGMSAPPVPVVKRSLNELRTTKGVALGQTPRNVEALYGPATLWPVPRHTGMTMLLYVHMRKATCGQNQTFVFKRNRLIYIDLTDAC